MAYPHSYCCTPSLPSLSLAPACSLVSFTLRTWSSLLPMTSWSSRTTGQENNLLASSFLGSAGTHRVRRAQSGHRGSGHVSPRPLCSFLSSSQIVAVRILASRAFKALHCLHLSAYIYVQSPDHQTPTLLLETSEPGWEKDIQKRNEDELVRMVL